MTEAQNTPRKREIEITLKVSLDRIDEIILRVLGSNPTHQFRIREISSILVYEGIEIGSGKLSRKMEFLAHLDLVSKVKRGRYSRYGKPNENGRIKVK